MLSFQSWFSKHSPFLLVMAIVLGVYFWTLQTIPNGSGHAYMIDVGETQVTLNVWGTLHPTGYPLYTLLGNIFTWPLRALGLNPAALAGLFSMLWTALALWLLYHLLHHWTQEPWLAALLIGLLGLMRSIWIHSVIAEVYSLGLVFLIALWHLSLYPHGWGNRRVLLWVALVWGLGAAHHRILAFLAPALLVALWPRLMAERRALPWLLPLCAGLVLLGFLPYLYIFQRLAAGEDWVYSREADTWEGFWFYFQASESEYLIQRPPDLAGWWANLEGTAAILSREMFAPGLWLTALACGLAARYSPHKRVLATTALSGLGFLLFAIAYHRAVLPEATLMMALPSGVVALALAWPLLKRARPALYVGRVALGLWMLALIPYQEPFIRSLISNDDGLEVIRSAGQVPRQIPAERPVFMMSWGPRYFAASYSRLVSGENADLRMVDHNADIAGLAAEGYIFYTQPDTFYGYPLEWWSARLGPIYLSSPGYKLVRLSPQALSGPPIPPQGRQADLGNGLWLMESDVTCQGDQVWARLVWYAESPPPYDLSVKLYLSPLNSQEVLSQVDKLHPVEGWRPTRTWQAGEWIPDHYQLNWVQGAGALWVGFYRRDAQGEWINYPQTALALPACPKP
jgi:hypothetical protein